MKILVLVTFLSITGSGSTSSPRITDFVSRFTPAKLAFLAQSFLHPNEHNNSPLDEQDWFYLDLLLIDFRTLLTQSIKVDEYGSLPELDLYYKFDNCEYLGCYLTVRSENSQIIGQKRISSINKITPTSFENSFSVPSFVWRSPGFIFNQSAETFESIGRDFYIGINNLNIETSLNYEYVQDLGIQISNLKIGFNLGYMRANIENVTEFYPDGSVEFYGPIKFNIFRYIRYFWKLNKQPYEANLQLRINCFLSGFRLNPDVCKRIEYLPGLDLNILQLMQTIGLGSLAR